MIKKNILLIFIVFIFFGCSNKTYNEIFEQTSRDIGVNKQTIKAICYHESGHNPYAINVNKSFFNIQKGSHFFENSITANLYMDLVLDPLGLNYDVGICQINKIHLDRYKVDNEDLLNPQINIKIAAKIYKWNVQYCKKNGYKEVRKCALSMYNTGYPHTKSKIGNVYANKVINLMKRIN